MFELKANERFQVFTEYSSLLGDNDMLTDKVISDILKDRWECLHLQVETVLEEK
jgi:hypothetical protein